MIEGLPKNTPIFLVEDDEVDVEAVIPKPFDPALLKQKVAQHLHMKEEIAALEIIAKSKSD